MASTGVHPQCLGYQTRLVSLLECVSMWQPRTEYRFLPGMKGALILQRQTATNWYDGIQLRCRFMACMAAKKCRA